MKKSEIASIHDAVASRQADTCEHTRTPAEPPGGVENEVAVLHSNGMLNDVENRYIFVEKLRFLGSRMQQLRQLGQVRSVLVTSAIPREGKTLVALNLALILARGSSNVALVDADLRGPSIYKVLGVPEVPGLGEVLAGAMPFRQAIRRVEPFGLHYVPAGKDWLGQAERLQDPRTRELLADGLSTFDWVILDSPPLSTFADAQYLAMVSDTIVLVARARKSSGYALRQAVAALSGYHIAGVVLNGSDAQVRASHYRHYIDAQGRRRGATKQRLGASA